MKNTHPPCAFEDTQTGKHVRLTHLISDAAKAEGDFRSAEAVTLLNGDDCNVSDHVILRHPTDTVRTVLGRVVEIVVHVKSFEALSQQPSVVLIERVRAEASSSTKYQMPRLSYTEQYLAVRLSVRC